jgi:hypothetical protein
MKKLALLGLFIGLVFIVSNVYAGFPKINTGNSITNKVVNTGVSTVKNKAIADDINKSIRNYNCKFSDSATTTATTCNMDSVINTIKSKKSTLEAFGLAKVYVHIKASGNSSTAYKRSSHIRDVMYGQMNWWRYNVRSVKDNSNNLAIWVEVKD